jgi:formylglycine-generating enzyme required for sulfatase activity
MRRYPAPTCPIGRISWYEAAAYCNWLSREEGLPEVQWCYEIEGNRTRIPKDHLLRTGYRLPTESEMEYVTRAGAITARHYGESDQLLPEYAWYFANSREQTWPVGTRKPNDLGLFDVHGNLFTWCDDVYEEYSGAQGELPIDDRIVEGVVEGTRDRVLRGGSFTNRSADLRFAYRDNLQPSNRIDDIGFRIARTLLSAR